LTGIRFRVLGAVGAERGGKPLALGSTKQRCMLALLLLEPNRLVHVDRLTSLLWGEHPPPAARGTLQAYVSRLRQALRVDPEVALTSSGPCYRLDADPDRIDLQRFRRLVGQAAETGGEPAVALLREALALWRGRALDDVAPEHLRSTVCANLNDERLNAWETLADLELGRGHHTVVLRDLTDLAEQYPLRERLAAQLMIALYRNSQRADALAHYRALRSRLAVELGIDPPAKLDDLHRRMLRDDAGLLAGSARTSPPLGAGGDARPSEAGAPVVVPAQLPADLATFTGRGADLGQLPDPQEFAGAMVVAAIDGMAGVGKTTLAVHWAHRIAGHFPDGHFFIDLHSHSGDLEPVTAQTALDRLLRDLGVPGERVPDGLDARAGLYRSVLAGRRVLIVLDDAGREEQVRPLLPGSPGCLAIVTSRRRLAGLEAAYQVSLDVPPQSEAAALFTRVASTRALADEPAVAEVLTLLGRLPLAIRIAAARLRARPSWTPRYLAERLRDERHRLAELDTGERGVAAAFALSINGLPDAQRRLFRLLGLHPGADLDAPAAAALTAGTAGTDVGMLLERLVDENLLLSPHPGRYQLHDLVRAYAAERATAEEPEAARGDALTRLFDHYADTAARAAHLLYPHDAAVAAVVVAADPDRFIDVQQAADWLDGELPNLVATAAHAARCGDAAHPLRLSRILWRHLAERSRFGVALALYGHTLDAAAQAGDAAGQARALVDLGTVHGRLGHFEESLTHLRHALELYRSVADRQGEVRTLSNLGVVHERLGHYQQAIDHLNQALPLYRSAGDLAAEASALVNLGISYGRLGRHAESLDHLLRALALHRKTGNRGGEGRTLVNLGLVYERTGRDDDALEHHRQALDLFAALGSVDQQGDPFNGIGNVLRRRGEYAEAIEHHHRALELFRAVGNQGGEAEALNDLGRTLRAAGRGAEALARHLESLPLAERARDRYEQARALEGIARGYADLDDTAQAVGYGQGALALFTDLGAPESGEMSARLNGWAPPPSR
jgi:DNA-binding SARP family transcriptional activator/Flp pilus assembly protein TadD